jgi:hypothetical protein
MGADTISRTPVRLDGGSRPRLARRWRAWGAPAAAAAAVIALAVSVVIVKDAPFGNRVPPAGQARVLAEVPRYYAAITLSLPRIVDNRLLVGDTFTGKTLASFAPPPGSRFIGVWGAADDRTFVASMARVDDSPYAGPTWYLLRLTPGSSPIARLSHLPIKQMPTFVAGALSASGRELAVITVAGRLEVPWLGVYSVASGRLLRSWSVHGTPSFRSGSGNASLTWSNGDREITFQTVAMKGLRDTTLRRLNLATEGDDLVKDSRVIWSSAREGCSRGYPVPTSNGKTVTCGFAQGKKVNNKVHWEFLWQAYQVQGPTDRRLQYLARTTSMPGMWTVTDTWWVSASGSTMIVAWNLGRTVPDVPSVHFGAVSHGTFIPLKLPQASVVVAAVLMGAGIAW